MNFGKEIAKNNMIFTAGNVGAALLSFVFSIVVAGMLGPEQFGLFSFTLIAMGFFAIFTDMGTTNTLVKFISEALGQGKPGSVRSLVVFLLKFRLAAALLLSFFMLLFSEPIASLLFQKPGFSYFIMLAAAMLIAESLFSFVNVTFISFKDFRSMVALRLAERALRIAIVVSLVVIGLGAVGASIGVMLTSLVACGIGALILSRYRQLKSAGTGLEVRKLASFGFWSMIGSVVASIYVMADGLIVSIVRPISDIGFYSIASSWTGLIAYVIPISSTVMYPYFSRLSGPGNHGALHGSLRYALVVAFPASFLMSAFSTQIIGIFYSPTFAPAAQALSVLSIMAVPLVVTQILSNYFYGIGRPRVHTYIVVGAFSFEAALGFTFTLFYGIWGAAAAIVIARVVESAILMLVLVFRAGIKFKTMDFVRPLAASAVIYLMALQAGGVGLLQLVVFGAGLLLLYLGIMVAAGGIRTGELRAAFGIIKSAVIPAR
ncbi:MAG: hypothetical protein FJY76_02865 [Candidatus Aenigmarchaeota archaeon]|nr:hypothetical protein [Candidatus Aenigmarchaeota archaeon]